MALTRIRHFSIFWNARKVAEAVASGLGDIFAQNDDGSLFLGISNNLASTEIEFETIVAVGGTASILPEILHGRPPQNVVLQSGLLDGAIWECEMRCTRAEYDEDRFSGILRGSFIFVGGEPTIIGRAPRPRLSLETLAIIELSIREGLQRGLASLFGPRRRARKGRRS